MKRYFIFISSLHFITLLFVIKNVYTKSITIFNEDDFRNAVESQYSDIIIDSSLTLYSSYSFNKKVNDIRISGKSKDITINFNTEDDGFFFDGFKNVELKNITFIGNLFISDCSKFYVTNVDYDGLIQSKSSFVILTDVTYHNHQNQKSDYGIIQSNGNMNITRSSLYSSPSINKNLIYFNDNKSAKNELPKAIIYQSYLSGEYNNALIKVSSYSLTVAESNLEKAITYDNGFVQIDLNYIYYSL